MVEEASLEFRLRKILSNCAICSKKKSTLSKIKNSTILIIFQMISLNE